MDELLLLLGAFLFCTGITILLTKRNLILLLFGLELMLNGANINLVVFNGMHPNSSEGQLLVLFIILVAVCEAAVGLALVLRVYHFFQTSHPDQITSLRDKP